MPTHLELLVGLPDCFAVCFLPPTVPVFSEEAHRPAVEQKDGTAIWPNRGGAAH